MEKVRASQAAFGEREILTRTLTSHTDGVFVPTLRLALVEREQSLSWVKEQSMVFMVTGVAIGGVFTARRLI